jgi:hypothetical protein
LLALIDNDDNEGGLKNVLKHLENWNDECQMGGLLGFLEHITLLWTLHPKFLCIEIYLRI